jgi:hypothetical protein
MPPRSPPTRPRLKPPSLAPQVPPSPQDPPSRRAREPMRARVHLRSPPSALARRTPEDAARTNPRRRDAINQSIALRRRPAMTLAHETPPRRARAPDVTMNPLAPRAREGRARVDAREGRPRAPNRPAVPRAEIFVPFSTSFRLFARRVWVTRTSSRPRLARSSYSRPRFATRADARTR